MSQVQSVPRQAYAPPAPASQIPAAAPQSQPTTSGQIPPAVMTPGQPVVVPPEVQKALHEARKAKKSDLLTTLLICLVAVAIVYVIFGVFHAGIGLVLTLAYLFSGGA